MPTLPFFGELDEPLVDLRQLVLPGPNGVHDPLRTKVAQENRKISQGEALVRHCKAPVGHKSENECNLN